MGPEVLETARPASGDEATADELEALDALIEEARRRARRRRRRYGLAALAAAVLAAGASLGFGGGSRQRSTTGSTDYPRALASPRVPETAYAGITVLGEEGFVTITPSGRSRTIIRCDRFRARLCLGRPYSAAWSRDGRRLAFATWIGPGAAASEWSKVALHVYDTRSGRHLQRRLGCFANDPDWSPDGLHLAYSCNGRIHLIASNLSGRVRTLSPLGIGRGFDSSVTWAPDGARLAFARRSGGVGRIVILPLPVMGGAVARVVTSSGTAPAWSPDGTRIAYLARCGGIKFVTPAGVDVTPPSGAPRACRAVGVAGVPVWSPDGRKLAISKAWPSHRCPPRPGSPGGLLDVNSASSDPCVRPGIYTMNADGSGLRLISRTVSRNPNNGGRPTWRPRPAR